MTPLISTMCVRSRNAPSTIMFNVFGFFSFAASTAAAIGRMCMSVLVGSVMILVDS